MIRATRYALPRRTAVNAMARIALPCSYVQSCCRSVHVAATAPLLQFRSSSAAVAGPVLFSSTRFCFSGAAGTDPSPSATGDGEVKLSRRAKQHGSDVNRRRKQAKRSSTRSAKRHSNTGVQTIPGLRSKRHALSAKRKKSHTASAAGSKRAVGSSAATAKVPSGASVSAGAKSAIDIACTKTTASDGSVIARFELAANVSAKEETTTYKRQYVFDAPAAWLSDNDRRSVCTSTLSRLAPTRPSSDLGHIDTLQVDVKRRCVLVSFAPAAATGTSASKPTKESSSTKAVTTDGSSRRTQHNVPPPKLVEVPFTAILAATHPSWITRTAQLLQTTPRALRRSMSGGDREEAFDFARGYAHEQCVMPPSCRMSTDIKPSDLKNLALAYAGASGSGVEAVMPTELWKSDRFQKPSPIAKSAASGEAEVNKKGGTAAPADASKQPLCAVQPEVVNSDVSAATIRGPFWTSTAPSSGTRSTSPAGASTKPSADAHTAVLEPVAEPDDETYIKQKGTRPRSPTFGGASDKKKGAKNAAIAASDASHNANPPEELAAVIVRSSKRKHSPAADHAPPAAVSHEHVPSTAEECEARRHEVIRCIERFGFAVAEDPAFATTSVRSLRQGPAAGVEATIKDRTKNVEQLILNIFSVVKTTHYGGTSTWGSPYDKKKPASSSSSSSSASPAAKPASDTTAATGASSTTGAPTDGDMNHLDLAYANACLALHTDNTYFNEPAKLQGFGLIYRTEASQGGETTLCDGFAVARHMHERYPAEFAILATTPVIARYVKEGRCFEAAAPVIGLRKEAASVDHSGAASPSSSVLSIDRISYNPIDRCPMVTGSILKDPEALDAFYTAYHRFGRLCSAPEFCVRFLLKIGQVLFFDNYRVLHARDEYRGPRVMAGAYVGLDDYRSAVKHVAWNTTKDASHSNQL